MSEFKVIREDKYGVFVEDFLTNNRCLKCKHYTKRIACANCKLGGRYLTEQEEQEYYSAKKV